MLGPRALLPGMAGGPSKQAAEDTFLRRRQGLRVAWLLAWLGSASLGAGLGPGRGLASAVPSNALGITYILGFY